MEKGIAPRRYTDLEKQELIQQWKESGKSKAAFCKERSIGYYTFNDWVKRRIGKNKTTSSSFISLQVKSSLPSDFATLTLKNGSTVSLHQRVEANYLMTLLKA
jgi:transposase-like protein